ncbi:hypothetical protein ASG32_29500 [Methylobacterium sp. Leaf361]|uniref:hypothetical protein n=1 Tax=unclassified Methylobacterium TaxID=2615210 RepID=UPI0006F7D1EE|nr:MULTISPECIES: hypothetical protein [unclassified Methylobacterium]KQS69325.1 hypothetical protein ASG32_29500 [Methylobacterium sp. Leaf361]SFT29959.1 hypothetical protein SAMN04487845_1632 [Methylobacterium sp. yr668]
MTYTVRQLAAGSYDVLLDGAVVASLVREVGRSDAVWGWLVELLDETSPAERPAPFTAQQHAFRIRAEALKWLGIPEDGISDLPPG